MIALLPALSGDTVQCSYAWRIVLAQPIIDARVQRIATEAVSSYPGLPTSSGYENGIDLQLMYLLHHGCVPAELVDKLAAMPIGRIKEVIAEYFLASHDVDRGFRLLIDAIPFAEHATLEGIGMWLGELSSEERRAQVRQGLMEAKRKQDFRLMEALEFALEQMAS